MWTKIKTQLAGYDFFNTLKLASTYFKGTIFIYLLSLVSIPLYTALLSKEDFGVVGLFLPLVQVLVIASVLNLHGSFSRYYYEEQEDFDSFVGTHLYLLGGLLTFLIAGAYWQQDYLIQLLNIPPVLFLPLCISTFFTIAYTIFNNIAIAQKRGEEFTRLALVNAYARVAIAIPCILWLFDTAYLGRIWGETIVAAGIGIYSLSQIIPLARWRFEWKHVRYSLAFSIPLLPLVLSGFILNFFDAFMINKVHGEGDTGLYTFAYKVGILLFYVQSALSNAARPDFYKMMNRAAYKEVKGQAMSLLKMVSVAAAGLLLFTEELVLVLAWKKEFIEATPLIPVIIIGYFFFAYYQFLFARIWLFTKKTLYPSLVVVGSGVINILLNAWLIPEYGYEAAAFTTAASYLVLFVLGGCMHLWSNRNLDTRVSPWRQGLLQIFYFALVVASYYGLRAILEVAWFELHPIFFIAKGLLFILFGGLLFKEKITAFLKK